MSTRTLLVWNGSKEEAMYMVEEFRKRSYEVVYLISNVKQPFTLPGTIVHIDDHARAGIPSDQLDSSVFPPPSAELIQKLYKAEALIMTMMNRKVDRPENPMVVDQKKRMYYELVRYWQGIFATYKPELIVMPAVPHNVSNFTIYSLAKLNSIPVLLFQETWFSDRILAHYGYDEESPLLAEALERNQGKAIEVSDLSEDIRSYYHKHTEPAHDPTHADVKVMKGQYSGTKLIRLKVEAIGRSVKDLSFFQRVYGRLMRVLTPNLRKEYEALTKAPDLSKPFVYVPLHWQPECSTSPLGEMYADQILMVQTLSAALPSGWKLYVKEHPFQWSVDGLIQYTNMRYLGYYATLASIPNVELVPVTSDTFALTSAAKTVATVTGRAGVEAVLRGVPTFMFGHAWYRNMPGVFRVNSVESAGNAFDAIERGYEISELELMRYLKSFEEATVRGYLEPWGMVNTGLSRDVSLHSVFALFEKTIEKRTTSK